MPTSPQICLVPYEAGDLFLLFLFPQAFPLPLLVHCLLTEGTGPCGFFIQAMQFLPRRVEHQISLRDLSLDLGELLPTPVHLSLKMPYDADGVLGSPCGEAGPALQHLPLVGKHPLIAMEGIEGRFPSLPGLMTATPGPGNGAKRYLGAALPQFR